MTAEYTPAVGQARVDQQREQDRTVPAGLPLGINTSDKKEAYITFGDPSKVCASRFQSVTGASYQQPVQPEEDCPTLDPSNFHNLTPAQQFHFKPLTAMTSAHVGLQTRQDLPIDDRRFHEYRTTHQMTYTAMDSTDVADVRGRANKYCANNRASDIPQGDPAKVQNNESLAKQSFVNHGARAYERAERPSHYKVTDHLLGKDAQFGGPGSYVTASASTYVPRAATDGPLSNASEGSINAQHSRTQHKSSIAIGDAGAANRATAATVYRQDFLANNDSAQHARQALRSSVADRINSKSGVRKAIRPDTGFLAGLSSTNNADFRDPTTSDDRSSKPAAGYIQDEGNVAENSAQKGARMTTSSIPNGDNRYFNTGNADTTNHVFFKGHPDFKMIPHPILGANITKSSFRFSHDEDEQPASERFQTSSHTAYLPHNMDHAGAVRYRPPHTNGTLNANPACFNMREAESTQKAHFREPPSDMPLARHTRYDATPRVSAEKRLLFPIRSSAFNGDHNNMYSTSTNTFFKMRDGLNFVPSPSSGNGGISSGRAQSKNLKGSSIAFGDNRFSYYRELTVKNHPDPIVSAS
ncbi:hypothetical protein DFS34DRAFT_594097 [Phlyctochytrium arcticum]|nr:hypothetical protein DFS34DRAFT_594097 [Phlyctochytrium arcticum]